MSVACAAIAAAELAAVDQADEPARRQSRGDKLAGQAEDLDRFCGATLAIARLFNAHTGTRRSISAAINRRSFVACSASIGAPASFQNHSIIPGDKQTISSLVRLWGIVSTLRSSGFSITESGPECVACTTQRRPARDAGDEPGDRAELVVAQLLASDPDDVNNERTERAA